MKRRAFIDWLIGLSGTALGGLVLYPVLRYLVPPRIPEATTRRVVAAKEDELAPNSAKTFPFGNQPGILVRDAKGDYHALSAVCTHLACTVQYKAEDGLIWCACHNGYYDIEGRNVSGPPPKPLEQFVVHVEGGDVMVEKASG